MFDKLKRKRSKDSEIAILAPIAGDVIPITHVSDPTFSEKILGEGLAIKPAGGRAVSPIEGTVTQMFDTGHAVSLTSDDGVEVLIHIGLDTVRLKGKHFTIHAHDGDRVKPGDLLIEFDVKAIAEEGYDTVTPVVICNSGDYRSVSSVAVNAVAELGDFILIAR